MEREEIIARLKEIIKPYVNDQAAFQQVTEDSDLLRDLKINSAHMIDVILDTETMFDIQIDDEAIEKMGTIRDAVSVIQERIPA